MKSILSIPTTFLVLTATITPLTLALPRGGSFIIIGTGDNPCASTYNSCTNCNVTFRSVWDEAGLRRYRFTFDGDTLIHDYGQDFLTRLRCHDGNTVANNWQCWGPNPDGTWTFDVSELDGPDGAKEVNQAVQDVVGYSPNIPL